MDMLEMKISEFLDKLKSKDAVPGGGGASALAAAIGSSLGTMVGSLTVGKKKYADVEEDIKALMAEMSELSDKLAACVNKDAELFEPLSKAYGIPKEDPDRDTILEKCLKDAASAPFEIIELSCRAIELLEEFYAKGSSLMISDAVTGAVLVKGAMLGAAVNVRVNTRLMKDRAYAEELDRKVEAMIGEYSARADRVFESFFE
ncbi:MAG: cyclodeaminase/cyclohydrolase family protein [Mogibacterium sp.]|nr:cyclodeaminase/cyclohydrolase family protein [Mogibacterium sp.]